MIDKIDTSPIHNVAGESSCKKPDLTKVFAQDDADVAIQLNYAFLVNEAIQGSQEDNNAVQRAQELLESGQLENRQNISEAVENILSFGV